MKGVAGEGGQRHDWTELYLCQSSQLCKTRVIVPKAAVRTRAEIWAIDLHRRVITSSLPEEQTLLPAWGTGTALRAHCWSQPSCWRFPNHDVHLLSNHSLSILSFNEPFSMEGPWHQGDGTLRLQFIFSALSHTRECENEPFFNQTTQGSPNFSCSAGVNYSVNYFAVFNEFQFDLTTCNFTNTVYLLPSISTAALRYSFKVMFSGFRLALINTLMILLRNSHAKPTLQNILMKSL